tara:strand:+ start:2104 stop:4131 length:2028 start_codon:yes stop_codon:yes gene_type:complete
MPSRATYRSEIDGLRAFAVLSVVVFHAFPGWLRGGFIGVDIFFVISGFLITSHIFQQLEHREFDFTDFFGRRIRRIFPALIIVMTGSLVFGWFVLLADEYAQLGKHVAASSLFVINFLLANESGYFDNVAETKPMLHLWSLAIEEQFYIIWPVVLWLAWHKRLNLLTISLVVALISFYLNLQFVKSNPIQIFFWPMGRFWELLSGSILAWLILYERERLTKAKSWIEQYLAKLICPERLRCDDSSILNIMSISGLLLLIFGIFQINESLRFPSLWGIIPTFGAVLIISAGSKARLNQLLFMNPVAVWFGLISYPLYLWHWPILSYLQIIYGELPDIDIRFFAVLVSVLLAWLTYKFIERPIRFGSGSNQKTIVLILGLFFVGSIGWLVKNNNGETNYNYALKYISDAKDDWAYPDGLHRSANVERVFVTSEKPVQVIFLGDSHIEQYGPRVVDLYKEGLSKEVAFITSGGCAPIPHVFEDHHKDCFGLLGRFKQVIRNNPIETIVIGADFNGYFGQIHSKLSDNTFYYKNGDIYVPFHEPNGQTLAKGSMYDFTSELAKKYRVAVLLDIPTDQRFHPNSLLEESNTKRSVPLSQVINNVQFQQAEFQIELATEMTNNFREIGVEVVDQASVICPKNLCSALDVLGRPIYKDTQHMRPFFVKEEMDVLDEYFRKVK